MPAPPDDSLPRWQGKIDALLDGIPKQIDTLFKALDIEEKSRSLEIAELRKELHDLATKLSNLTARLAMFVAVGSFIGTTVTSLFVAAIIKIFLK